MGLFLPVTKDLLYNRIVIAFVKYWKDSFFGPPFPTVNYIAFSKTYKFVVNTMKGVVVTTWKSMFVKTSVKSIPDPKKEEGVTGDEASP